MSACGWCGQLLDGFVHHCPKLRISTSSTTPAADYEAADMVHRNRLGLAREAAAASTVDLLAAEVRELTRELRIMKEAYGILREQLTIATCAALAANEFYRAEYMGEKTYLTPTETRERFGSAMVAYREATGADNG